MCAPELTEAEAIAAWDCAVEELIAAWSDSGHPGAEFASWTRYSTVLYPSGTHGGRLVHNYANDVASNYGQFEDAGTFAEGSILAKPSVTVSADGKVVGGPLFLMEKMGSGFREESGDWRYTMIDPNGVIMGTTRGPGADMVEFCIACHASVAPFQDHVLLLPDEYRAAP